MPARCGGGRFVIGGGDGARATAGRRFPRPGPGLAGHAPAALRAGVLRLCCDLGLKACSLVLRAVAGPTGEMLRYTV